MKREAVTILWPAWQDASRTLDEGSTADAAVLEAEVAGGDGVDKVPTIEDQRCAHGFAELGEIDGTEFGPFGGDDQCLGILGGIKG
jgi:hypothetical protein